MGRQNNSNDKNFLQPKTLLRDTDDHAVTMPPQKGGNPFEIVAASSTSQISPSPARTKSQGSANRHSMSGNRAGRSVSFGGNTKAGAEEQQRRLVKQVSNVANIATERVVWQQ